MADALQTVELHDDFYRDRFGSIVIILVSIVVAIVILVAASLYLYLNKPKPTTFALYPEWRVQVPVPLDQPYLSASDLLQWVSDAILQAFVFDFYRYNDQLKSATHFFTPNGWKVFLNQLNSYVNYNKVQAGKQFVNATPTGSPFILQQGLLSGRYAWWVQMPVNINYASYNRVATQPLTLQILVVRVSTLNNLNGVGIDNVIVVGGTRNQQTGT